MSWIILVISAVFEAVWATALGRAEGFTAPVATAVFLVAITLSMAGLAWAAKVIPIGTAYAVWTGLGATFTFAYAMVSGSEEASVGKLLFLGGILGAVVGLKLLPREATSP